MAGETTTAQTGQTQTDTVPKAELDSLKTQHAETLKNLEALKGQLLDTDYLQYLESKKAPNRPAAAAPQAGVTDPNRLVISNMTLAQLQQVIGMQLNQTLEQAMKPIYGRLNEVGAKQELDEVRAKFEDFPEYSEKVVAILEGTPNTELTIEQAYLIAKAGAINEAEASAAGTDGQQQEQTGVKPNEKPGGTVPLAGETAQRFKNPTEAATAAWHEVRQKYGLSGDTI